MSSKVFFGGFYLKREEEILTSSLLNLKQPQKTFAGIQLCTGLSTTTRTQQAKKKFHKTEASYFDIITQQKPKFVQSVPIFVTDF